MVKPLSIGLAPVLLAVLITSECVATDRSFVDIEVYSPANRWRVTAVSPHNRSTIRRPWQHDFVYSAFRDDDSTPQWTRDQSAQNPPEGSPLRVIVADTGWVAIHTQDDQLVFVDSTGRNRAIVDDIKHHIPEPELDAHAVGSSGGFLWDPNSLWYFLTYRDEPYFVVRLWWGRQLAFRPESGQLVENLDSLRETIRSAEKDRTLALLALYLCDPIDETDVQSILLGAHLAGVLQIEEAIPWLQQMDRSDYVGIDSTRLGQTNATAIDPFSFRCFTVRRASRLALRRMHAATSSAPIYEFRVADSGQFHPNPTICFNRVDAARLRLGSTVNEVLEQLGPPDYVAGDCWEYDDSADSPLTFVVRWDENYNVGNAQTVAPKWQNGLTRDFQTTFW